MLAGSFPRSVSNRRSRRQSPTLPFVIGWVYGEEPVGPRGSRGRSATLTSAARRASVGERNGLPDHPAVATDRDFDQGSTIATKSLCHVRRTPKPPKRHLLPSTPCVGAVRIMAAAGEPAFCCAAATLGDRTAQAMFSIRMTGRIGGQPVPQKALARSGTPRDSLR